MLLINQKKTHYKQNDMTWVNTRHKTSYPVDHQIKR